MINQENKREYNKESSGTSTTLRKKSLDFCMHIMYIYLYNMFSIIIKLI